MANRTDYKEKWAELKADPIRYAIHLEHQRQQYAKRKDQEHARAKAKYQRDKEYYKRKHAEWYAAHKDKWKNEYAATRRAKHAEKPEPERERSRAYHAEHRVEINQRHKEYREGDGREKSLKSLIRSAHRTRLSPEQLEALWLRSRNGPCEICGLTGVVMHLDHCHKKNVFRGILCDGCNRGIGYFKENPEALRKAAEYLERKI